MTWSVRPCSRNPLLAAAVVVFVLVMSFAVQVTFGSPWWGAFALVVLSLSVLPYYATTRYELDEHGVAARGPLATYRRAWTDVVAWFPVTEGVLLSPLPKPSRLAFTRGLFVRFNNNRDEVLRRVEACVGQPAGARDDAGTAPDDDR